MLVLLFVALWFILRGDLFKVLPCVTLFLCFPVLLALRLLRLGKRDLISVLFVCLFDLRLFGFVCLLPLCVWKRLWLVTEALHGIFSYLFYTCILHTKCTCVSSFKESHSFFKKKKKKKAPLMRTHNGSSCLKS